MADAIEHPEKTVASLNLSGSTVEVGLGTDPDTIILNTDESVDYIYMSRIEACLLIAALNAAVEHSKEH